MLEAAASAMFLVETGVLRPRGTLGEVLREEPYRPVHSEPDPTLDQKMLFRDFDAAIDATHHDRDAALRVLRVYTACCRSQAGYERRRLNLVMCGVPDRFLPHWADRSGLKNLPAWWSACEGRGA